MLQAGPALQLCLLLLPGLSYQQEGFQTCCKTRRLYYPQDGQCYKPLQQGPCPSGQWLIMEKGGTEVGLSSLVAPSLVDLIQDCFNQIE